jgi:hypothetical protein
MGTIGQFLNCFYKNFQLNCNFLNFLFQFKFLNVKCIGFGFTLLFLDGCRLVPILVLKMD